MPPPPRPPWYQQVARHLGCRAPNLLYGYPLAFKHRKDLAGDKKCPKFDTVFENRGIYWPAKKEKSLQLAPTTPKWSQILRVFFFFSLFNLPEVLPENQAFIYMIIFFILIVRLKNRRTGGLLNSCNSKVSIYNSSPRPSAVQFTVVNVPGKLVKD